MGRVVSATQARIHFGELMREAVETGEPVIVQRGGKPTIVVLSVTRYESLLQGEPQKDWRELVSQARAQIEADLEGRPLPPPEEILSGIREERDERLVALR